MPALFFNRALRHLLRHLCVAVALGAAAASAQAAQPCRVEPFGLESAADRARDLARPCGGEHLKWNLSATPRRAMLRGQPHLVRARLDSVTSRRFGPGMLATLKLNWAASGDSFARRFQTDRMALAAGGWYRFDRHWAFQANIGRERTSAERTRATLATVWRPVREALLFAEWAGTETGTEMHRIGARWWLVPRRLALDVGAIDRPDDGLGWQQRRVGLTYGLLH